MGKVVIKLFGKLGICPHTVVIQSLLLFINKHLALLHKVRDTMRLLIKIVKRSSVETCLEVTGGEEV